ncbi:unnamed protein product [Coffea canephora]|uniref:Isopenicillin N synthase-like Fe(2+) 2OG dioxygenase domain-containing protein n=1 Tax=Coffea canephora TaxID=49390 RepID=A0A068TZK1_COFCA|nr:unnamed protein product [Coffea canephora]
MGIIFQVIYDCTQSHRIEHKIAFIYIFYPTLPSFVCQIDLSSELVKVLSNNRLKSATHRVYRMEGTERDSFAFFYSLKPGKWVEPLPQFTTEIGEPPKYRGFLYDDYMQLRRRDYTDNQPDKYEDIARITYYAINA